MLKRTLQVELSDELKAELKRLEDEVAALNWLVEEIGRKQQTMIGLLQEEVVTTVAEATQVALDEAGIQVFAKSESEPEARGGSEPTREPLAVALVQDFEGPVDYDHDRRRSSPYRRVPRHEQVQSLLDLLSDGEWWTAVAIARRWATDPQEFRYIRHSSGHRLREMFEEGLLERQASAEKGAMFEYRRKRS